MSEPTEPTEPGETTGKPERFWTGAHTTHRLRYHLAFIPKYRKRVLAGPVAARLRELIGQACEVNGWEALELAVQPDHVHLLIQVQPRWGVPQVMKSLKGGTSRVLRAEFPDLSEFLWGSGFWAVGYFAATVGVVEGEAVARYIREQREL
jgi:putative transposase